MTRKALALLRRAHTEAKAHLAFLERCAALDPAVRPRSNLVPTPGMIAAARTELERLAQMLADNETQLPLFGPPHGSDM